jgi:hypothetical protein
MPFLPVCPRAVGTGIGERNYADVTGQRCAGPVGSARQHTGVTDVIGSSGHAISGIGDGAVWEDGDGEIVPSLGAWKGNVSCLVQPDSDVANDIVPYTGKPPFTKITDSDGVAYAQKMGKVCTDVFAAG